jgi:hypothetical protein
VADFTDDPRGRGWGSAPFEIPEKQCAAPSRFAAREPSSSTPMVGEAFRLSVLSFWAVLMVLPFLTISVVFIIGDILGGSVDFVVTRDNLLLSFAKFTVLSAICYTICLFIILTLQGRGQDRLRPARRMHVVLVTGNALPGTAIFLLAFTSGPAILSVSSALLGIGFLILFFGVFRQRSADRRTDHIQPSPAARHPGVRVFRRPGLRGFVRDIREDEEGGRRVREFRLEQYEGGARHRAVAVRLRGRRFTGFTGEGHEVEVWGKHRGSGMFEADAVFDYETGLLVKGSGTVQSVLTALAPVILPFTLGGGLLLMIAGDAPLGVPVGFTLVVISLITIIFINFWSGGRG